MRTIPKKNYFLVGVIVVVSFFALWYVVRFYQVRHDYQLDQNKRMNVLSEIKEGELQNYILDNHDVILYFSSSREQAYATFERELIAYLKDTGLSSTVVYIDTNEVSSDFYQTFQKNYGKDGSKESIFEMIPNLVVLTDGQVSKVLYSHLSEPKIEDVITFLEGEL